MNDRAAQLASSFARAQQLTKVVANPEFDSFARNLKEGGYIDSNILSENYVQQEMLPYNPNNLMPMQSNVYNADAEMSRLQQFQSAPIRNDIGLPRKILEDIQNNPLNGLSADPTMDAFTNQLSSVTSLMPQQPQQNKQAQRKPSLTEQLSSQQNQQQIVSSNFDYDTMKMIMEGVVKKYIEPLKENLITETKNKETPSLKMMRIGENFQFMDNSGNVYEAVLKYKCNVNDIKKKKAVK